MRFISGLAVGFALIASPSVQAQGVVMQRNLSLAMAKLMSMSEPLVLTPRP